MKGEGRSSITWYCRTSSGNPIEVARNCCDPMLFDVIVGISSLGSKFWHTSKRMRAVRKSDFRKRVSNSSNSSSESDFDIPHPKRGRIVSMESRLEKVERELSLQGKSDSRQLRETHSRYTDIRQCFECLICKETVSFPALVSPCCNIVVGCQSCVEQWLTASPQCPQCRARMEMGECNSIPFIRSLKQALSPAAVPSPPSSPLEVVSSDWLYCILQLSYLHDMYPHWVLSTVTLFWFFCCCC